MQIEPNAWIVTLPLTIALIQIYMLPCDHGLKRFWQTLVQTETTGWTHLGWSFQPIEVLNQPRARRALLATIIFVLTAATLASLAAFAGIAPSA